MAKQKFYAVFKGVKPGIYQSWDECEAQVDGYPGAMFKSFKTRKDAVSYLRSKGAWGPGVAVSPSGEKQLTPEQRARMTRNKREALARSRKRKYQATQAQPTQPNFPQMHASSSSSSPLTRKQILLAQSHSQSRSQSTQEQLSSHLTASQRQRMEEQKRQAVERLRAKRSTKTASNLNQKGNPPTNHINIYAQTYHVKKQQPNLDVSASLQPGIATQPSSQSGHNFADKVERLSQPYSQPRSQPLTPQQKSRMQSNKAAALERLRKRKRMRSSSGGGSSSSLPSALSNMPHAGKPLVVTEPPLFNVAHKDCVQNVLSPRGKQRLEEEKAKAETPKPPPRQRKLPVRRKLEFGSASSSESGQPTAFISNSGRFITASQAARMKRNRQEALRRLAQKRSQKVSQARSSSSDNPNFSSSSQRILTTPKKNISRSPTQPKPEPPSIKPKRTYHKPKPPMVDLTRPSTQYLSSDPLFPPIDPAMEALSKPLRRRPKSSGKSSSSKTDPPSLSRRLNDEFDQAASSSQMRPLRIANNLEPVMPLLEKDPSRKHAGRAKVAAKVSPAKSPSVEWLPEVDLTKAPSNASQTPSQEEEITMAEEFEGEKEDDDEESSSDGLWDQLQ